MKGARTKFGHMTITYLGPALWNGLPYLIKINKGIHNFKKKLKKFLFQCHNDRK